jgi:hypothetical protein
MLAFKREEDAGNMFKSVGAGETDLVELTRVFRSTPEITRFLTDLDTSFPALDLPGEWGSYDATSSEPPGEIPQLIEYSKNTELLDNVFSDAYRLAAVKGGRRVAVLCLNDELFRSYLNAGRIADKMVSVTGRDQVNELRYAGKRCVFSMPDYVAGLQFETVYLIHADKSEFAESEDSIGVRRRFVSRCYLGASRASSRLYIASSAERGGPSDVLKGPIRSGSLVTREGRTQGGIRNRKVHKK